MNAGIIARLTFGEARQRRLFWMLMILAVAFLIIFGVGFVLIHRDNVLHGRGGVLVTRSLADFLLMAGLYVVNFLAVVLAILTSVDTISGEIASGTIQTVVTKPLRRWEVVIGKWVALAGVIGLFIAALSTGVILIVGLVSGFYPPNPVAGVLLMVLEGLIVLTLSILGGTRLSTIANGIVVFMLWGLGFVAGWIEQIGTIAQSQAAVNFGIVVSLVIPSETMWRRAAYLLQPPLLRDISANPFGAGSAPSSAMVVYALIYVAVLLALAVRGFSRRDL